MREERDINLDSLLTFVEKNKIRELEGKMQRFISEIFSNIYDQQRSEAEKWVQKAMEADQRNGMRFDLGRDYALYAELFKRRRDRPNAKKYLRLAIGILKECGAVGWAEKYEKELASIP